MLKRIAITGGAGHVATQLRPLLGLEVEHLRLVDRNRPGELTATESFFEADLADAAAMGEALDGMDGVIHLGGIPREADIDDILRVNALGTYNLYEAARANGVGRVVFASSNHATGFYPCRQTIKPLDGPRPDSRYGLSKAWGELVAGYYYDVAGIRTLSIRIGNAALYPNSERSAAIWISARDLFQLVKIGLNHPDIAAAVVYGMSGNDGAWWRDELAERLGYKPQDNGRDQLRLEVPEQGPVAAFFQGGSFCAPDHDGRIRMRTEEGLVLSQEEK